MLGQSEYARTYRSPDELRKLSPDPPHHVSAGLSSAEMAVTHEPALPRKRKDPSHDRKVTFTTDYTEHGSPTKEEDKGLRYRSGFRRANIRTPSVYQLQYTWKTPEFESPLLSAEKILHRGSHPTQTQTERQPGPADDPVEEQQRDPLWEHPRHGEPAEEQSAEPMGGEWEHGREESKRGGGDVSPHRRKLDSKPKEEPPKSLSTSEPPKSKKRSHHHKKSRHHRKQFVSEYQAQFKCWPVTKKESEGAPAFGSPQVFTDSSDPRLLKHLPLPIGEQSRLPASHWRSEYNVNFVSPTEFKYVKGAWQKSPQTDMFSKPLGDGQVEEIEDSEEPLPGNSWFEQLVELRHKAELYKKRACGTHFSRTHLLRMERDQRDLFERASSSSCLSSQSSTGSGSHETPSDEEEEEGKGGGMKVEDIESVEDEEGAAPGFPLPGEGHPLHVHVPPTRSEESVTTDRDAASQELESEPHVSQQSHTLGADENTDKPEPPTFPKGRVPTPLLHDSPGAPLRHHLDLTTPSDGGLLISQVKLPYPLSSPKFRRDMRSSAPIFPSQDFRTGETEDGSRRERSETLRPQVTSTGRKTMSAAVPVRVPPKVTSSTTQNVPKTGAFQRLQFESGKTKTHRKQHQSSEATTHAESCETCGAKLRPPLHSTMYTSTGRKDLHARTLPAAKVGHTFSRQPPHSSYSVRQPEYYAHTLPHHFRNPPLHATTHTPNDLKQPTATCQLERDIDAMSLSSVSLSSCSVASDMLKRARNRRDTFWMKPQVTS